MVKEEDDVEARGDARHCAAQLIMLFDQLFSRKYNTRLIAGNEEPLYLPGDSSGAAARILFTQDYFSSALHEIAHWCIAGPHRRQLVDYGYWYCEDGRLPVDQVAFERVEIKPQALEWIFSEAAGYRFRISLDNLNGAAHDEAGFKAAIVHQARQFLNQGLPQRAERFSGALQSYYQRSVSAIDFSIDKL